MTRNPALALIFGTFLLSLAGCASVPMAPEAASAEAKSFEPDPDQATIYVFRDQALATAKTLSIWLDGKMCGALAVNTFFRWDVEPGSHRVASKGENYDQVELSTEAGELYFVRVNARMGWVEPRVAVETVREAQGRQYVTDLEMAADMR